MYEEELGKLGLTPGETKVYLALLKLGPSTSGIITDESGVSRSKIYNILSRLENKGLVGHSIQGKVKHFKAMGPKFLLRHIEDKKKQFSEQEEIIKKLIPQLEKDQKSNKTQATLYQGFKAIKNFYLNILEDLSPGETYHVIGVSYGENFPGIAEFYSNYHKQRVKKKIKVKMLANHDTKFEQDIPQKLREIKYLPQYLVSNMIINFYKDKTFIFFLSKEPVGFLIESKEVKEGFQTYFDTFWKLAKEKKLS